MIRRHLLFPAAAIAVAGLLGAALPDSRPAAMPDAPLLRGGDVVGRPPTPHGRPAAPVRIEIPAIGVRAPIITLGLKADGTLEVPVRFGDAGWWSGGARPGERGPAVIAGHVDSRSGPAVFYRLPELRAGDAIAVVLRGGRRVRFVVRGSQRYPKASFPTARVYGPTRDATLRLITCSGAFDRTTGHYVDNTVVYADGA